MDGHDLKDGRKLYDLELLAELQHHGAATCLIDFTSRFLVALWFACQKTRTDGMVFIVNTNNPHTFRSLEEADLECGIEDVLNFKTRKDKKEQKGSTGETLHPQYWHWSPHGINRRILKQDGLFIFGKEEIGENDLERSILISKAHKSKILEELRVLGITEESLFKDMPGFAALHDHNKPIKEESKSAEVYFRQGNDAFQRGNYKAAIENYNKVVPLKPDYAEGYLLRGLAKANSKRYPDAIADFEKAIKRKGDYADAWRGLGTVKLVLGQAGTMISASGRDALKTAANLKLYEEAIDAYEHAVRFKPEAENYCDLGNAKFLLGEYEAAKGETAKENVDKAKSLWSEAVKDLNKATSIDENCPLAHFVRAQAKLKLGNKEGAREDYAREQELAEKRGESETVETIREILSAINNQAPNK